MNGDVLDPYLARRGAIKAGNIQADSRAFSSALRDYQQRTGHPIIYVPGNHEGAGFTAEDPQAALGADIKFDVRPPFSVCKGDYALTHGHLLDPFPVIGSIPTVRRAIRRCLEGAISAYELGDVVNSRAVHDAYWQRDSIIDGMFVHPYMLAMRMLGKEEKARKKAAERRLAAQKAEAEEERRTFSVKNGTMTDNAASLAVAVKKSVICVGHDHQAGLTRRSVNNLQGDRTVIVANSGSALSQRYTAVYIDGEAVHLLDYDKNAHAIKSVHAIRYNQELVWMNAETDLSLR